MYDRTMPIATKAVVKLALSASVTSKPQSL